MEEQSTALVDVYENMYEEPAEIFAFEVVALILFFVGLAKLFLAFKTQ